MQINNAYSAASQGIRQGVQAIDESARNIAQAGTSEDVELVEEVVSIKENAQLVKANMQVIKTVQDMEQHVLDVMA